MLTELSQYITPAKFNDYLGRLDNKDPKDALSIESELAVLWAISRVAHILPEPVLTNGRTPDARSDDLFASGPSVVEVRALSDDSFSGKEAMDRTANIIASYADRFQKRAGDHLYFEFLDRKYWTTRFHRERCVDPEFELSDGIKGVLRQWITASDWPNPERIRIAEGKTDVVISWKESTIRQFRTFCRMPPVAYHLEKNPVYNALWKKNKLKQLKGTPPGTRRCVVLVDAGCYLLSTGLRPRGTVFEISGEAIIHHALAKLKIDTVIVLSPYRHREPVFSAHSEMFWKVSCFDNRTSIPDGEYDRIWEMADQLPKPQFEGDQARDRHGSFVADKRRWYLPTCRRQSAGGKMTIKLSARLLHEYLAGRIDGDQFREKAFNNEKNYFDSEFARGHEIIEAHFESGGVDADDDYVVFDLDINWNKLAKKHPK